MKTWKRRLFAFVVVVYCIGCSVWFGGDFAARLWDARNRVAHGFVRRTLIDSSGNRSKYVVFVPHVPAPASGRYPVLLFLNGFGENGDDGLLHLSNNFGRQVWEMQDHFPFIAVAPQCSRGGSWVSQPDATMAMNVVDAVLEDYECDPDRIYLFGVSSGGAGVHHFVGQYPDRFAAVVAVSATSGGGDPTKVAKILAKHHIPLWSFYNGSDREGVVSLNRSLHEAMHANGCDYHVTEYNRPGHNAWDYACRDPAMYRWLLSNSREKNAGIPKFRIISTGSSDEPSIQGDASLFRLNVKDIGDFKLVFEARLAVPLMISLESSTTAESVTKNAGFSLGPLDRMRCFGDSFDDNSNLFGQFSIRSDRWNSVTIERQSGQFQAHVNGWLVWRSSPESNRIQSLRVHSCATEAPGHDAQIRHLSCRSNGEVALTRVLEKVTDVASIVADTDSTPAESLLTMLKERSSQLSDGVVAWRVATPTLTELFSMDGAIESRLQIDSDKAFFTSMRVDAYPKRMNLDTRVPATVSPIQFRPLMLDPLHGSLGFSDAIASKFTLVQPAIKPAKHFERLITATDCTDYLSGRPDTLSKVVCRDELFGDVVSWARLTPEMTFPDQLNTLHQAAAFLSMGSLHREPLHVNFDDLQFVAADQQVSGKPCVVLREVHSEHSEFSRTFWIDKNAGGLIRRYYGTVKSPNEFIEFEYGRPLPVLRGDVCIEIDYDSQTKNPTHWKIVNGQSKESPLLSIGYAEVVSAETNMNLPTFPDSSHWTTRPHTWVADKTSGSQYINLASGKRRPVGEAELSLDPTFAELASSLPGKVGETTRISTSIQRVRLVIALISTFLIGFAVVHWRRSRSVEQAVS